MAETRSRGLNEMLPWLWPVPYYNKRVFCEINEYAPRDGCVKAATQ
jgi:hypothetical protein